MRDLNEVFGRTTNYCFVPALHYHWHAKIVGGAHCAGCTTFVHQAWLRCNDYRPLCDGCYYKEVWGLRIA